jgi:hypothetical protein
MLFNCTEIDTFKSNLDNSVHVAKTFIQDSHPKIKIQSLLNITIYVLATRFLEGSVKIIIYNCAIMRSDSEDDLKKLENNLKNFR